jgi:post-segregation antitoxin (ccd killing protein)
MGKEQLIVEIDSDLMARLRAAGVDPQAYIQRLMDRKAAEGRSEAERREADRRWAADNREAIAEYNARVEERGTLSERMRRR